MILRDAIRSLKSDKSRTFFYWITYFLTSLFIFLFFNIMMSSDKGMEIITSGKDMAATFIVVVVVVICLMCIQFANNFYVHSKGKDIAVRLICGATFTKVTAYLMTQTLIIMLMSIPFGILLGILIIPLMNTMLPAVTAAGITIGIHSDANLLVFILLAMIIAWSTAINFSFTYTNAAFAMMNNDGSDAAKEGSAISDFFSGMPLIAKQIIFGALFVIPIIFLFNPNVSRMAFSMLGLLGVWGVINYIIAPSITTSMNKTNLDKSKILAGNGFLRKDLVINKSNIMLFIGCAIIQISIIADRQGQAFDVMLFTFSFILMNCLLAMMIMFKTSTEQAGRTKFFKVLNQIGFQENALKAITRNELVKLYGMVAGISLIYIGAMLAALYLNGELTIAKIAVMLLEMLVPVFICFVVNIFIYRKAVLTDLNKPL